MPYNVHIWQQHGDVKACDYYPISFAVTVGSDSLSEEGIDDEHSVPEPASEIPTNEQPAPAPPDGLPIE